MSKERGVIQFRDRQKQINDFRNLKRLRNITPTDIDGLIDYAGKNFIYLEGKVTGVEMPFGQKMALENAVKSHWKAGHKSMAIVYEHWTPSHIDVNVAGCRVVKVFGNSGNFYWETCQDKDYQVLEIVEEFEKEYKII